MPKPDDCPTVRWIYRGRIYSISDGKLRHVYQDAAHTDNAGNCPSGAVYTFQSALAAPGKSRSRPDQIGAIYEVDFDGKSAWGAGRWVGVAGHVAWDVRVEWSADDRAAQAAFEASKRKATDDFVELLAPIHRAYRHATGAGKRALLLDVLRIVQTGR